MKNIDAFKAHGDIIWNIANLLRGPYRPPQYRRVMIPLTVLRRLDCVLEASKDAVIKHHKQLKEQTDKDGKPKYDAETIEKMVFHKFKLAFFNTSEFTFQSLLGDPDKLAANLANYMAGFSSRARKIIEKFKFEEEIEKLEEANRLFDVIKQVAAVDLHPDTIPNIAMGYLFEDLVRRFNEQANEEAGDHFTPREVIKLMVNLLFTHDDLVYRKAKLIKIYDPTCGTGGMLSESEKVIKDPETGLNPSAEVRLFGQEYNPESFAICGSDLMIKGEEVNNIVFGDTLGTGKPKEGFADGDGHPGEHFHFMLANPPFGVEWKPEKDFVTKEHDTFGFKGRFGPGLPRINDGALLFLLHMISKMQPAPEKGGEGSRIAVVFNGSPLFTGDAGSGESNIRRWIIENDMLEAVIGLPDQLFYNTGIYTYIWLLRNEKPASHAGQVMLIDARRQFEKEPKAFGNKRNRIADAHREWIEARYRAGWAEGFEDADVKLFRTTDFAYHKVGVVFWQTGADEQPAIITEPYEKAFTAANIAKEQAFHASELSFAVRARHGDTAADIAADIAFTLQPDSSFNAVWGQAVREAFAAELAELTRPIADTRERNKAVKAFIDGLQLAVVWTHRHYIADDEYIPFDPDGEPADYIPAFLAREIAKPIIRRQIHLRAGVPAQRGSLPGVRQRRPDRRGAVALRPREGGHPRRPADA